MSPAQYRAALEHLAQGISETIAIRADEQRVGVGPRVLGDVEEYKDWAERLHQAVDDGLEAAQRRAEGLAP